MQLNKEKQIISGAAKISNPEIRSLVVRALEREAASLIHLIEHLPPHLDLLVEKIVETTGKVVFAGLGKSWLVGKKLAATFSSVGIPAIDLHAGQALHGDLGVVQPQDVVVVLSKSATGDVFEYLFSFFKLQGNFTVLMCCGQGTLTGYADLVVQLPFDREACELNLAPTSSSTIMMAVGDAVAIAASRLKGFGKNDFARFHPAGALGKRLLLTVNTLMYTGAAVLPLVGEDASFTDLLYVITSKKLGVGIVIGSKNELKGIITDGDLRRACAGGPAVFDRRASDIMTANPKTVSSTMLALRALEMMEAYHITSLVVVDDNQVVGLIHIHDLIKAGIKG